MASMILFGHACPSRLIQSPWQAKDNALSLDQKSENLDQTSVSPSWTIYKDLNNIKFIKKALNMSPVYSSIPYQGLIFISYDARQQNFHRIRIRIRTQVIYSIFLRP